MSKSVLIVSYTFPPMPGIGGRRWAKFAKYLKRNGHLVKVVAAKNNTDDVSDWMDDIEELKVDITYLKSYYPKWLTINPNSYLQKILYRLSLAFCKILIRGNYYDRSSFMKRSLIKKAREIIVKNNIKNVICTVGPFKLAYYVLKLKEEFPEVNFVVDFRDPWTNNKISFGYDSLSKKRFDYEVGLERAVVNGYDLITAVSPEMFDYLHKIAHKTFKKRCIPNGFDKDDFARKGDDQEGLELLSKLTNDDILVVFTGTLYNRAVHVFKQLVLTFNQLSNPFKNRLKFLFAGTIPHEVSFLFDGQNFFYLGKLPLYKVKILIKHANYCALFITDDYNYSTTTKYYEYIANRKPILSFSNKECIIGKFIENNKLGFSIIFTDMEEKLNFIINAAKSHEVLFNPSFDVSAFDIENLTKQLEQCLI